MFLSVIVISRDGNWTPSNGIIYVTFLACVLCHAVLASTMSKIMGKLQSVFVIMNFILIAASIIALPIGARHRRNDGRYIFATTENLTTWPTGWAFMLSWLSPIWTIGAFDSCLHLSEEAAHPTKAVPFGILMSIGSCWLFGFIIMIVLAATINPDLDSVVSSKFGQPMAQVGNCLFRVGDLEYGLGRTFRSQRITPGVKKKKNTEVGKLRRVASNARDTITFSLPC